DVLLDDGADAEGLGSYVINALKILLEKALEDKKKEAKKGSDSHGGDGPAKGGGGDVSKDAKDEKKAGSIASAKWSVQRAADGQGGEKKSDPIFVDRAPFKFSI